MTNIGRNVWWLTLLVLAGLCCGCARKEIRKPVYPVTGRVTLGGKGAEQAFVVLHPLDDADPANWPTGYPRALTGPDGSFLVGTYEDTDGAPAGTYKVVIEWREDPPPKGEKQGADRLKGRYSAANSQFKVQVAPGPNTVGPFEVTAK